MPTFPWTMLISGRWLWFVWKLFLYNDGAIRFMWLWEFGTSLETAARALLLSEGLFQGPTLGDRNEPLTAPFGFDYGITGVGLYARNATDIVPCVYTVGAANLEQLTWLPFPSGGPFYDALVQVFGTDLSWILKDLIVVQTGPMELQADPGDPIQTSVVGQLGAPVQWGASRGFLTAGHVGKNVGTTVQDSALNTVGKVVFALDPTGKGATPETDVAVVELAAGQGWGKKVRITGAVVSPPLAAVDIYRRSQPNPVTNSVRSKASWWIVSQTPLTTLLSVYITTSGATGPGDSGGPVLLQGTSSLIGHIAAGGPAASCLQDVRHQLRKIKSDPAFTSIRI